MNPQTRLYVKKNPEQCWVARCKNKGEPFTLACGDGVAEADVILCEKHGEEAQEAGQ
jgi:hypothetical protein